MFERTFTFWRRLVGKSEPERTSEDERRLWVRYPADMKTSVQLADLPSNDRVAARIRDISRGGANLLVDQSFQMGQMLTLELPRNGGEETLTLLGCVVRSNEEKGGRYSLGCVFSRELTEEDLLGFGARRVRHAPEDQRTWKRFDCNLTANFEKIGDTAGNTFEAQVLNISASGVGLDVRNFVDAGALINLHLIGQSEKHPTRTILTCVVHVTKKDDNVWSLGCNFIRELTEADFRDLVS